MYSEEMIALDCPYCQASLIQPLSWFKQSYATCPVCAGGIAAGQFAPLVETLEQAFDASVEEMILGTSSSGCGCNSSGCGCNSGGCGGGNCGPSA